MKYLGVVYGQNALCYLAGKTKKEDRKSHTPVLAPVSLVLIKRSCSVILFVGIGMGIVDSFNHNPEKFIFLISTTAGGTGLNLTAANRVVIFGASSDEA